MDTKKLRQKILDLAIRGKLVPQDPNDEPASVLLERIRTEKERLIKEGKIKRSKKTVSEGEIEAPFEIPKSWEWTTICEIASSILYGVSESAKESGNYKLLRITDIQNNKVNWESVPFTNYDENKAKPYLLQDGDILFARTGATVGKSYLVEGLIQPSIYASYLIRVQTSSLILPSYIKLFFESGYYWEQISLSSVGIGQPNVNGTTLAALSIPIPPYQEQHRISNEVERWFTLIDELESNEGDLLKAIDKAKSKILDLAIHGKLVPQDPNDEPAIELLKRINPKFEPCKNATDSIVLPDRWCFSKLKDVCTDFIVPQRDKPTRFDGDIPWCRIEDIEGKYLNGSLSNQNVSLDLIKEMNMRICPIGTVLCSCSASLGIQAITTVECCTNQTFIGIVPQKNILEKDFLYYFLMSQTKRFFDLGTGTTIKYISRAKFEDLIIPIPPLQEQFRVVAKIEELFAILDNIKESLE